jgi:hypothetical protein
MVNRCGGTSHAGTRGAVLRAVVASALLLAESARGTPATPYPGNRRSTSVGVGLRNFLASNFAFTLIKLI